jgi:hypothetical protein
MAHRPSSEERDRPLTRQQVAEYKRKLEALPSYQVSDAYRSAYERCRMENDTTPRASAIQELVVGLEADLEPEKE